MRLFELYEIRESGDRLYHVTHAKYIGDIRDRGIAPMGAPSNWVQQGSGDRYGMGEVYVFTSKEDAKKWAGRMDWDFNQAVGSGNIAIITLSYPEGHKFEKDEGDPMSQAGAQGDWLKTYQAIPPQNILNVEVYEPNMESVNEAKEQTVGVIFGRFNPPHKGHKAAWEMASKNDEWYVGTNKSTQGPKDPMPYDVKIKAMEAVMPEVAGHIAPSQSWLTLASEIYEKHGKVVLRAYTDEKWVTKALVDYNGVSKPEGHGFYDFAKIEFVTTPRLSSATAVRDAVAADDREAFEQAAGVSASFPVDGKDYFDVVKHYLSQYQK